MLPREGYTRDRAPHCNTGRDFRYALQHNNPISYFVIMRLKLTIHIYVILCLQCRQQKQEECAFYVCRHIQQIMSAKTKNPEGLNIDLHAFVMSEISEIWGGLCGFIKTEIVNASGEFHSVDTAEPPSNNWFNCNSLWVVVNQLLTTQSDHL